MYQTSFQNVMGCFWAFGQVAAYDKKQMKMAFFDPSRPNDFVFISGTKV